LSVSAGGSDIIDYGAEELGPGYDNSILGIEVEPGDCLRIIVGRFMVIGKVISRTKTTLVIEDLYGIKHALYVSKITMISELPCSALNDIRQQIELRRASRRRRARRKKEGEGEGGG